MADGGPRSFAIVGGGFRSGVFLRIARELPELFEVAGVITRRPENGQELERQWGVASFRSLDQLLRDRTPDFVVVSVAKSASTGVIAEVVDRGLPVLAETPPAPDVAGLVELYGLVQQGARIQVAEQYHLEPLLSAQIATARSGLLGAVTQAYVSVAHDYHGISVLRRLLGVGFEDATVSAAEFTSRVKAGPSRAGDPREDHWLEESRTTARLDFGDRLGVYDFSTDQYRSWIRTPELVVRGELGELRDEEVRYLQDYRTPMRQPITRVAAGGPGSHEGMFLRGLVAGDRWVYRNEFLPARLADDELSVATLLSRMVDYLDGGPEPYSLAQACQDHYLALTIAQAVQSGETVPTQAQPWSASE